MLFRSGKATASSATNYPRIDHIFSSGFTPLRFATVDQRYEKVPYISDHYPIAAVLEFK